MTTTREATATSVRPRVHRYSRPARWFHAFTYLLTGVELATGWWLLTGREGRPSLLSTLARLPDPALHVRVGVAMLLAALAGTLVAGRSAWHLIRDSVRFSRSDLAWLRAWPRAAVNGRFTRHNGFFDPGQRIANLVMVAGIAALIVSGGGLALTHGGQLFVVMLWLHKAATYLVTPVIVGHVIVASGLLPGYQGVWRSMHGGSGLDADVALRLWPAWAEGRPHGRPGRRDGP
jgi:cytochrome b subunit of formate dehydrogenase